MMTTPPASRLNYRCKDGLSARERARAIIDLKGANFCITAKVGMEGGGLVVASAQSGEQIGGGSGGHR